MSILSGKIVSASLLSLVIAASAASAFAATVTLPQTVSTGFNSTNWYITGTGGITTGAAFSGSCGGQTGLAISDASITGAGDAYDNAYQVFGNGTVFAPGGSVDLTGTTITAGPVMISGLSVTTQYYFSTASSVARILVSLQNPTGAAIAAMVQIPVNFGSDGTTIVRMTSSGDATVTTDDRWVVSSDNYGPSDPVNLTVMYGPGAVVVPLASITQTVFSCAGTEGLGMTYNLNIPAGTTQSLMLFAGLGGVTTSDNNIASAQTAATLFDSNATLQADWLAGLSEAQRAQVVNWNLGFAPTNPAKMLINGTGEESDALYPNNASPVPNPVHFTFGFPGCSNAELHLAMSAPDIGLPWSYLDSSLQWQPLPAILDQITPFVPNFADNGTQQELFSGYLPPGPYEFFLVCDSRNGHLDTQNLGTGTTLTGMYAHRKIIVY